jgi:hypothetical protein
MNQIELERLCKERTLLKQLYALDRERYVNLVPRIYEIKQIVNSSAPHDGFPAKTVLWDMELAERITKSAKENLNDLIKEMIDNNIVI